jgi:acetyltransferase-like isoleucine patch superfamily enzyme
MSYKIGENCRINKAIINGAIVNIGNNVTILNKTVISCHHLEIGDNSSILERNRITGSASFKMGANSRIIDDHFIDVSADVTLGNNTWIAGRGSQIWTHGSLHTKTGKDLSVKIGDDVYVGSSVLIAPGVEILATNLIGLGSVVSSSFLENHTVIAGNPAKVVKKDIDWRENW